MTIRGSQKALRRLAAEKAPDVAVATGDVASAAGWTGTRSASFRENWSNRHELTLAKEFVEPSGHDAGG